MSKESFTDQIARLELMASGDPKWDLSDSDCAAIKALLVSHGAIQQELFAIRTDLRARLTDEENVKYPTTRDKIRFIDSQVAESQKAYNHQAHCAHLLSNQIDKLKSAVDTIPAAIMLLGGPPYKLNFTEATLREIAESQK